MNLREVLENQRRIRREVLGEHDETPFEKVDAECVEQVNEAERRFRQNVIARPGEWREVK